MKLEQMQIQQQLAVECLGNFFTTEEDLEKAGPSIPRSLADVPIQAPHLIDEVNRAILQLKTCVRVFESYPQLHPRVIDKTLEWLAARHGPVNLIDDLAALLIARLSGRAVQLPAVLSPEPIRFTADNLNEAARILARGQIQADLLADELKSGNQSRLAFPKRRPRGSVEAGRVRLGLLGWAEQPDPEVSDERESEPPDRSSFHPNQSEED